MLSHLQLQNFRCFESLSLRLDSAFNFFIGGNGEGKTSILEAACLLLRLQSQRSSSLSPIIRVGTKSFCVSGDFDGRRLKFCYGGLRRKLEFDGVDQRTAAEYLRLARVVSLATTDIEIVRGGSEPRRRFLDFTGSQLDPRYRSALRSYERALRSRNALLKSNPPRSRELAAYDAPLIEHGTLLRTLRASNVRRLRPLVAAAHTEISGRKENIDFEFSPGNEDDFAAHLARTREEEKRLRLTIAGPHRDDIDLYIDGMSAQSYASEGQQRTLALALKIGQARLFGDTGSMPLLLIDDIFGELDPGRRNLLFDALPAVAQKLVTSTIRQWPGRSLNGPVFELRDGLLSNSE